MNVLTVKFQGKDDPPEPGHIVFHQAGAFKAIVLENGMASGKPAVLFAAGPRDALHVLETSAEQIVMLARIIQAKYPEVGQ